MTTSHRGARRLAGAATLCGSLTIAGCSTIAPGFGNGQSARANAEGFFGALAARYTNVQRSPLFARARGELSKHALTPSSIFNDSSTWTSVGSDGTRLLEVEGKTVGGHYVFEAHAAVPEPTETGQSRHMMQLNRLSDPEYKWIIGVDMALGKMPANAYPALFAAFLRASEEHPGNTLRTDYQVNFPHTTEALGRLYTLDSLRLSPDHEGATTSYVVLHSDPDRLAKAGFPEFAQYYRKYISSTMFQIVLDDTHGGRWFEATGDHDIVTVRIRSLHGRIVPLNGGTRSIPDTLSLHADFTTKTHFFTLGFQELNAEFVIDHTDHMRGWSVRFTDEPKWKLPPAVRYFIRTPLRRPFEGRGATFTIGVRDGPGGQTIIGRRTELIVYESAILRFLGKFGATAMSDFAGQAEAQENQFIAEALVAMKNDVGAILSSIPRTE